MADERPQYQHGLGTIGGQSFHWGSGTPGQYWSIPYGDYPVTPDAPTGDWAHRVGAIPIANNVIPDSQLGRNRIGIMIHSGSSQSLDQLYTQGCFKVAPSEWPAVRAEILKEAGNGPLYLHVQPGGVAAFTNTPTLSQAGSQTPAANANAVANTTASPTGTTINAAGASAPGVLAKPNSPYGNPFLDALAQTESNNQNIFSGVDKDYPGQPGSRSQGYFQIDTPTWQQFAAKAGVDVTKYPTAMNAPAEVQAQVAQLIPFSRFGGRTQSMLAKQFPGLDLNATVGENATKLGGGTAVASAAPPAAPADQSLWSKLTKEPVDAQGKPTGEKSVAEGVLGAFTKTPAQRQAAFEAQKPQQSLLSQEGPGMNMPAPMTYGQTIDSLAQHPLAWSNAPPGAIGGARAGFQPQGGGMAPSVPGVSLASFPTASNTAYGFDPSFGLGYGGFG